MRVNYPQFNRQVGIYLRSRNGQAFFDSVEIPLWAILVLNAMGVVVGLVLLVSIVRSWQGLKTLWSILRGKGVEDPWRQLRQQPELLRPLIGVGIIIGSQGHGLVLGTFDDRIPLIFLVRKSKELASLYASGASSPHEEEIVELLQDDVFQNRRRRRVVAPQAEGRELYLFDMKLKLDELSAGPNESVLIACVATTGEKGVIEQIPWDIAADSVTA
jgi:hypothetical protein